MNRLQLSKGLGRRIVWSGGFGSIDNLHGFVVEVVDVVANVGEFEKLKAWQAGGSALTGPGSLPGVVVVVVVHGDDWPPGEHHRQLLLLRVEDCPHGQLARGEAWEGVEGLVNYNTRGSSGS